MPPDAKAPPKVAAPSEDVRYKDTSGFKRNNPGNIMVQSIPYIGKATQQPKGGPVSFCTMAWGLRALARDMKKKAGSGINKIPVFLGLYAPAEENDTEGYIKYVAKMTGLARDEAIKWDDKVYLVFMKAIISMEIGYGYCPFSDDELNTAIQSAKTEPVAEVCEAPLPYKPPEAQEKTTGP